MKKLPPAAVDVAARMADPLPGIELTDLPLARAVDLLAAVGTLPITLDPDAMRQLGVAPRDRDFAAARFHDDRPGVAGGGGKARIGRDGR